MTKPTKLVLGVLCYGGQVFWEWARCWHELLKTNLVTQVASVAGDSLVCRARNSVAADAVAAYKASAATHLAFWDCDIEAEPWMWHRMLGHRKPIVCGMYPIKQVKPQWVSNLIPGEKPDASGLLKVRESGTGMMLIDIGAVLVPMAEKHPEIAYATDDNEPGVKERWDFFSVGVYTDGVTQKRRYLSEDYYFCQRWRDMGGDVFLDTRIQAKHIGRMTFPIPEQDLRVALREYDKLREPATVPVVVAAVEEVKGNQAA